MNDPHATIRDAAEGLIPGRSVADRVYRRLCVLLATEPGPDAAASHEARGLAKILTRGGSSKDIDRVLRQAAHTAATLTLAPGSSTSEADGHTSSNSTDEAHA